MPPPYTCPVLFFTTKTNKVDLVDAAHMNAVQTELMALNNRLLNNIDSDGSILSGVSYPSPALTSQQFWRTDLNVLYIYTGTQWSAQSGNTSYAAGTYLIGGPSKFVQNVADTSYTKYAEFIIPRSGALTIKFLLGAAGGVSNSNGRIYRNGSAVGTEQSNVDSSGTVTEFSENISGWASGDLCQLYLKVNTGSGGFGGDLRIYENAPVRELPSSSFLQPLIHYGTDVPPATLGSQGDLYLRTDGGLLTTLYVKTGASTWTGK